MSFEKLSAKELLSQAGLPLSEKECTVEKASNVLNHIGKQFPGLPLFLEHDLSGDSIFVRQLVEKVFRGFEAKCIVHDLDLEEEEEKNGEDYYAACKKIRNELLALLVEMGSSIKPIRFKVFSIRRSTIH